MKELSVSKPSVAVCIVTYNSEDDIETCLAGVRKQSWTNLELLIVDNASEDSTVDLVTRRFPEAKLIVNANNRGFAAAQNQAIRATNSDYVLVLNPDVELDVGYISKLVERMDIDPDIGSATGCLTFKSAPHVVDSTGLEINGVRRAVERGAGRLAEEFISGSIIFGVSGAAAMYSRKMIHSISIENQFFDEDFFAYKEDVDVAWRAQVLGWNAWYEPQAKGKHGRKWGAREDRKHIPLFIRQHSHQNRYLMIVKNEQFNLRWWARLPCLVGYELLLNGYLLIKEPRVLVGSFLNLTKLFSAAWHKRRLIQANRNSK